MKIAKFSLSHRIRAGITHITFLFRKIFLLPLLALALIIFGINVLLGITWYNKLYWIGEIFLWIIVANIIISLLFPISEFTRRFLVKGVFFGILNVIILSTLTWILHNSIIFILLNVCFYFWIAFFSTMSFSGDTMYTNPREIQGEYPIFVRINKNHPFYDDILMKLTPESAERQAISARSSAEGSIFTVASVNKYVRLLTIIM